MQVSGTDFGMQNGPYMSLDLYREFYKPYHKKINDWIHAHTKWKTFFHCCGSTITFMEDFIEAGVDILNPVQISAYGMDPKGLKEKWGDRIVFWGGGSNTQRTLQFAPQEAVYEETTKLLEILSPGGGYVFNTIHNIQGPTPTENMVAMYKALYDYNIRLERAARQGAIA
jgi:uroporphyrinogen-III decarboxylase